VPARGIRGGERAVDDEDIRVGAARVQPHFERLEELRERHALDRKLDRRVALFELRHQRQHLVVGPAHPHHLERGGLLGAGEGRQSGQRAGGEAAAYKMATREIVHAKLSRVAG
jgi:hypothetical protein